MTIEPQSSGPVTGAAPHKHGPIERALLRAAGLIGAALFALGSVVLVLRMTLDHPPAVIAGDAIMMPNTAIAHAFAGAALVLRSGLWRPAGVDAARAAAVLTTLGALVALLTLIEHVLEVDLGIDELVMTDRWPPTAHAPGRMAPNTAVALLLGSVALLPRRVLALPAWLADALSLITLVLGYLALLGYVLGASALTGIEGRVSMAVHTSIGIVLLGLGSLFARPDAGLCALIAQDSRAGATVRRLAPLASLVPVLLGAAAARALDDGVLRAPLALALVVAGCTVAFVAIVLFGAREQGAQDREREQLLRDERFVAELGVQLGSTEGADQAAALASAAIGSYLGVARCFVVEQERASSAVLAELFGLAGPLDPEVVVRLRASLGEQLVSRQLAVVEDTERHPLTREAYADVLASAGIRSLMLITRLRGARDVGLLGVSDEVPRAWKDREVALLGELADRTFLTMQRARAEEALRTANATLETRVVERTAALTSALREREALLKEVHHRVKNNLQVVNSMLGLQQERVTDPVARRTFEESQRRVQAMALVHEQLYRSRDLSRVPLDEFVRVLVDRLRYSHGAEDRSVEIELEIERIALPIDQAIPCCLLLNELVVNALEHAFVGRSAGHMQIGLARTAEGRVRLVVEDDGVGLPEGIDLDSGATLGLELVTAFVEQLRARLEVRRSPGACFTITFDDSSNHRGDDAHARTDHS